MEAKRNYIYKYKLNDKTPLCIYMCNTQAKNKILIIPLTENNSDNVYKLSVTRQYADLEHYAEIYKDDLISPLYLNSRPVRVPDTDITIIQRHIINNIMDNITSEAHSNNTSLSLFEDIYQFLKWKLEKLHLNFNQYQKKTTVYENGIYWVSLGVNVGSELNKNRPALIWKKRCNGKNESDFSYIIIPITSKEKSKKYYMNVPISINGRQCYLRIEDMRRINVRRISRPITDSQNNIIFIETEKREEIIEAIQRFYIFNNKHISS